MPKTRSLGSSWLPFALLLFAGCNRQDADKLEQIGHVIVSKVKSLDSDGWQAATTRLNQLTLQSRVSARLRWDKALEKSQIEVQAHEACVELKGIVLNLEQRQRAVHLAETTSGVEKVIDQLVTSGR
ncbi:MAG: hypothetical protein KatS3mg105_1104 [Gemmatales bacterium]|nr:MAG: hypothetical protein KatS3mg105_1104 [Gemmatales bacterium]